MTGEEGAVSEATDGLRLLTPVSVEEELRHRITNLESSIHAHQQLTERFKRQRDAARAEASELREIVRQVAHFDDEGDYDGAYKCHWCGRSYVCFPEAAIHDEDCPVTKACKLMMMSERGAM